jgi:hypothetical protein
MEACVGAHHLSRKLKALGHDARLMPAKYVHRADTIGLRKDTAIICRPVIWPLCKNYRVATNLLTMDVAERWQPGYPWALGVVTDGGRHWLRDAGIFPDGTRSSS